MANKDLRYISRAETISEIAVRNEMPVSAVRPIYNRFSLRYHSKDLSGIITPNPVLREKIFRSTEKYIDRQRIRNLNKTISDVNKEKITNFLTDITKRNNISYSAVVDIYNRFNDIIYGGEFDEKALKLTEKYFGIKKARELKNLNN
jgi:hypothetical protein